VERAIFARVYQRHELRFTDGLETARVRFSPTSDLALERKLGHFMWKT